MMGGAVMKKEKGFTLIEVLVVLSIISILFVVLVPQVNSAFNKTYEAGIRTDFRSFQLASEAYLRESSGKNLNVQTVNTYFDSSHQIVEIEGQLQSKKVDPFKNNYGTSITDRKIEFFSHGSSGDKNTKAYTLYTYYYKGFVDSCTTGFIVQNLELDNLKDAIEGFECGNDLPSIPIPQVPLPPPIVPAPVTPTNFKMSGSTPTSISLSWDASLYATRYVLKRDGIIIYTGSSTSFTSSGLSVYTTYTYSLTAENESGTSFPITLIARTMPTDDTVKLPNNGTGSCSPHVPYIITTVGELQGIKLDLTGCYVLGNNINASSTSGWNNGKGFEPIQNSGFYFEGQLDGKGFTIDNLFINRQTQDWVAMFNALGVNAKVNNIIMNNSNVSGKEYVGILSAYIYDGGVVTNAKINGDLKGQSKVGGVIGFNEGTVNQSDCTCNLEAISQAGGIVGSNYGNVDNTSSTGSVIVSTIHGGGIIGFNGNTGSVSSSTTDSRIQGNTHSGGVVGFNDGSALDLISEGIVEGTEYIGGVIGFNSVNGTAENLLANSVSGVNGTKTVGGIIGYNDGLVDLAISHANVLGNNEVGGVIGANNGIAKNTSSFARITGTDTVGGVVGANIGEVLIATSSAVFNIEGSMVGGIAGFNEYGGTISNATSNSLVHGTDTVGGAIGLNDGLLDTASSSANVEGVSHVGGSIGFNGIHAIATRLNTSLNVTVSGDTRVGGIAGFNDGSITLSNSKGTVDGDSNIGGLIGENEGNVSDSFATAFVTGTNKVGGLIGRSYTGTITRTFAAGKVTANSNIGGLVGENINSPIVSSYYDQVISTQNDIGKGVAKTSIQMKTQSTYSGWNFTTTWIISPSTHNGYPYLRSAP